MRSKARTYRADGGQLLAVAEPEVDTELLGVGALVLVAAHQLEGQVHVLEGTGQLTTGALDRDVPRLDLKGHCTPRPYIHSCEKTAML